MIKVTKGAKIRNRYNQVIRFLLQVRPLQAIACVLSQRCDMIWNCFIFAA